MLFDRSLVLSPDEVVEIEVTGYRRADVAVDGRPTSILEPGDIVGCSPSAATARFVRFGAYRYHQILKSKFGPRRPLIRWASYGSIGRRSPQQRLQHHPTGGQRRSVEYPCG